MNIFRLVVRSNYLPVADYAFHCLANIPLKFCQRVGYSADEMNEIIASGAVGEKKVAAE